MRPGDLISATVPGDIVEILDEHAVERVVRVEWIPLGFDARAVVWFSETGGVPIRRWPSSSFFVPAATPVLRVLALSIARSRRAAHQEISHVA